jgi:hypothetical protein
VNIVEILKNKYAKPQNRLNINAEINRVEPPSHLLQRRATKHTKLQGGGWVPKYDGTGLSVVTDPGKYSTAVQHEYYNELGSGYKDINKRVAKMIKSGDWDMSDIDQFPEYKAAYENITGGQGAKASESPKVEKQESTSPGGLSSSSMRGVPAPIMLGAWLGSKLFGSSEPSEEQAPEPAVTPGKVVDPDNEGWSPRLSKYTIRQTEKKIKEGNDVYNIDGYPYTIEEHEDGPRYAPAYPLLDREDRMRATIVARNAYVPGGNPSFTNVNTGDTGDVGGLNHTYTPSEQYTLKQYSRKNFINKLKEKGVYKNESPEYWNKIYEARLVGEKRTNTGGFWSNLTYPLYDLFGFNAGGASTVLDDILTEDEQYEIFGNIPEQLQHKTKSDLDRATGVHGEGYDMGGYWDS